MPYRRAIQITVLVCVLIGIAFFVKWKYFSRTDASITCADCNIVLIEIDPLRADALSAYGNTRVVTPSISALAKNGFVFTQAYAVAPWTLPSAMSLMTGVYPSSHGVTNKETFTSGENTHLIPAKIDAKVHTLAGDLKSLGYVTGGFAGGAALSASYGFSKGFDEYVSGDAFDGLAVSAPAAIAFMRAHQKEKMFIFLHGFDTHGQYTPPQGYHHWFTQTYTGKLTGTAEEQKSLREEGVINGRIYLTQEDVDFLRGLYDEKVVSADELVHSVIQEIQALKLTGKTVVIFTSNHGDEFYEHGRIDHGMTLYDEVLHVPLIMTVPGQTHKTIDAQVRNIDIASTIFNIIGRKPSPEFEAQMMGTSLVPIIQGKTDRLNLFAETDYRYAVFKKAVRTWDKWKLIADEEHQSKEIYNLTDNPLEIENSAFRNEAKESEILRLLLKYSLKKAQQKPGGN